MAKYTVEGGYKIGAYVEPEGYVNAPLSVIEGFEDISSFYGEQTSCEGTVEFTMDGPEDEDEATELAEEIMRLLEWESSAFTSQPDWEVEDTWLNSIEKVTEPMTKEKAKAIINEFIIHQSVTDELIAALKFILNMPVFVREAEAEVVA